MRGGLHVAVGILLAVGVILLITEMLTGTFVLLWLGISCVLTSGVLVLTDNVWITFIAFIVFALILWLSTQKFAKKVGKGTELQNGVYALIGKEVRVHSVTEDDNTVGTCQIYGEEWMINAESDLTVDELVLIKNIEGATLQVVPKGDK